MAITLARETAPPANTNPGVLPQHFDTGGATLLKTGKDNPLPVQNGTRTATELTTTPLGASAAYTQSPVIDSTAYPKVSRVGGRVFADQTGTLYLDVSEDQTNWDTISQVDALVNTPVVMSMTEIAGQYFRFRYVNGSTAQATFRLTQITE